MGWGVAIALAELPFYAEYLEPLSFSSAVLTVLMSLALLSGSVGLMALITSAGERAIARVDVLDREVVVALGHGAVVAGCVFVAVAASGSDIGVAVFAPAGVITDGLWYLSAVSLAIGASWGVVLFRNPHWESASRICLLLALFLLVAVQTFSSARRSTRTFHALLTLGLLVLAGWSPEPRKLSVDSLKITAICIFLCGAGFAADTFASHQMRLVIHDRTRISFHVAGLNPLGEPDAPNCENRSEEASETSSLSPEELSHFRSVRGVVLIVVDTLRADVVGREVDGQPVAPNLARFLEHSVRFEPAYTPWPATGQAMQALFEHPLNTPQGGPENLRQVLGQLDRYVALPSHLYLLEYLGEPVVVDPGLNRERQPDINVDPDDWLDPFRHNSREMTKRALAQYDALPAQQNFAMLVHYYDPHQPYVDNDIADYGWSLRDRYDAMVTYTDHWLGELLDGLEERGRDDVAIVITSDHGEEHGDHGALLHNYNLYEESTRIVMGVDLPNTGKGHLIEGPTSLVSLGTVIATLLDVEVSGREQSTANDNADAVSTIALRSSYKLGGLKGTRKAVWDPRTGVRELYDLSDDPNELDNLADARPETFVEVFCAGRKATSPVLK